MAPAGEVTKLTDYGRKLVAMYRAIEGEYQTAMDRLQGEATGRDGADKVAFQRLLRRITLRTSARNQFACTVSSVEAGPVNALVFLALDEDCELEAQITSDSVKQLDLAPGREVVALVKASAVFLLSDRDARTSVGNHLTGVVSRIHEGPVSAESSGLAAGAHTPYHCRRHHPGRGIPGADSRVDGDCRFSVVQRGNRYPRIEQRQIPGHSTLRIGRCRFGLKHNPGNRSTRG